MKNNALANEFKEMAEFAKRGKLSYDYKNRLYNKVEKANSAVFDELEGVLEIWGY